MVLIIKHTSHISSVSFAQNEGQRETLAPTRCKTQRLSGVPFSAAKLNRIVWQFLASDWGSVFNFYIVLPPAFLTSSIDSAGFCLLTYAEYWRLQFYTTRNSCGMEEKEFFLLWMHDHSIYNCAKDHPT